MIFFYRVISNNSGKLKKMLNLVKLNNFYKEDCRIRLFENRT